MPAESTSRQVFWNISFAGELVFYVLGVLSLGMLGVRSLPPRQEDARRKDDGFALESNPSQSDECRRPRFF